MAGKRICVKATTYKRGRTTIRRKPFCYSRSPAQLRAALRNIKAAQRGSRARAGKHLPRAPAGSGGGKYYRVRVEDPRNFDRCRTDDVGRVGHTKRIACYDAKDKQWRTQARLLSKRDFSKVDGILEPNTDSAARTLQTIEKRHGVIRKKKGGGVDEYAAL